MNPGRTALAFNFPPKTRKNPKFFSRFQRNPINLGKLQSRKLNTYYSEKTGNFDIVSVFSLENSWRYYNVNVVSHLWAVQIISKD